MSPNPSIKEQLDSVIETIIPIHTYDNQIVKEAKMSARQDSTEAILSIIESEVIEAGRDPALTDRMNRLTMRTPSVSHKVIS